MVTKVLVRCECEEAFEVGPKAARDIWYGRNGFCAVLGRPTLHSFILIHK